MSLLRLFVLFLLFARIAYAQTTPDFLNPTVLHEVRIRLATPDWQSIKTNYLDDTSYPASFAWNGYTLDRIGIKSRGSQSRSPIKPSLGLDFSKYTSALRFAGLKTLVLRNLNQDASMLHEFLAQAVFARLGLPHSRVAFAKLFVNDEYVGVYLMVEPVDARFVWVHLGEDAGTLYDLQDVPYRFEYLGPDPALYVPAIFQPKAGTEPLEGIAEMVRKLNQLPVVELSAVVDVSSVLSHAAAEVALANWDGFLGTNGIRNFYLYRRPVTHQAMLLGWDMDAAFTDIFWPLFDDTANNVLIRRLLELPENRERFLEALDDAAHAIGDGDWLTTQLNAAYPLIQQAAYADPYKLCRVDGVIGRCSNAQFDLAVIYLRQFAATRPAVIWSRLAGEFAHPPAAPDLRPSSSITTSPGAIATLKLPLTVTGPFRATSLPLPEDLAGITVQTALGPAELFEVCPESVIFLVPENLLSGPQPIQVRQNSWTSNTINLELRPTQPTILGHSREEAWIVLYTTGLGSAVPPRLTLLADGRPIPIEWAGHAPGLIGMQQINAILPVPAAVLQLLVDNEPGPLYTLSETP